MSRLYRGADGRVERVAGLAQDVTELRRIEAERVLGGATAQSSTFEAMRQQDGVDSDREMETLLTLERAYASNAKVLQAGVDEAAVPAVTDTDA